jgi:hypothetical protein
MFASPVANTCETLYQQALRREILVFLDTGWDLSCRFEGCSVLSGAELLEWWTRWCRRDCFGERELGEAADAGIATIPGG